MSWREKQVQRRNETHKSSESKIVRPETHYLLKRKAAENEKKNNVSNQRQV